MTKKSPSECLLKYSSLSGTMLESEDEAVVIRVEDDGGRLVVALLVDVAVLPGLAGRRGLSLLLAVPGACDEVDALHTGSVLWRWLILPCFQQRKPGVSETDSFMGCQDNENSITSPTFPVSNPTPNRPRVTGFNWV